MSARSRSEPRSGCPVSVSLEILGDRWSLLIIRDLMVRGYRTFKDFENAGEGIATNILAGRLRRLAAVGILTSEADPADRRVMNYRLTGKGIDLAPVLLELLIWGARHEETAAPGAFITQLEMDRAAVLSETLRRWSEHDATPLIPPFENPGNQRLRRKEVNSPDPHPKSPGVKKSPREMEEA